MKGRCSHWKLWKFCLLRLDCLMNKVLIKIWHTHCNWKSWILGNVVMLCPWVEADEDDLPWRTVTVLTVALMRREENWRRKLWEWKRSERAMIWAQSVMCSTFCIPLSSLTINFPSFWKITTKVCCSVCMETPCFCFYSGREKLILLHTSAHSSSVTFSSELLLNRFWCNDQVKTMKKD